MPRFWKKSFIFTAIVCALFAALMATVDGRGGNDFNTIRMEILVAMINGFHATFVEPVGLAAATAFLGALCLFVCGFFAIGKKSDGSSTASGCAGSEATIRGASQHEPKLEELQHEQRMRKIFGTAQRQGQWQGAQANPASSRQDARQLERRLKAGREAVLALETNGFDWFFAHYGDGYSDDIVAGLRELGFPKLAALTAEAGEIYNAMTVVTINEDRELTQEETTAYFEKMHPLDRKAWALYTDGTPR